MLIDARRVLAGQVFPFDVCIVGAGPAGIALAWELRNSGLTVGLLESGGFGPDAASHALNEGQVVGRPYFPLDNCRARYFGGSTNWWVAMCRPLDAIDFQNRPWVPNSGWPFKRAALEPHYLRAQNLLGIDRPDYEKPPASGPGREPLPVPEELFEPVRFTFGKTNPPWFAGIRSQLVRHPKVTLLLRANAVELALDARRQGVARVKARALGRGPFEIASQAVVLAAGGLENARLLLASDRQMKEGVGNANGLVGRFFMEHPNVTLGHFTPRDPSYRSVLYTRHPTEGGALIQTVLVPRASVQESEGVLNTSVAFERPAFTFRDVFDVLPRKAAERVDLVRLWTKKRRGFQGVARHAERTLLALSLWRGSADLRRFLPAPGRRGAGSAWTYRLYCRSEQHPDPQSRVGLGRTRDALGLPQLVLSWHLSPLDLRTLTWARSSLGGVLESLGSFQASTDREIDEGLKGGWHHMGTTRMSADPQKGVVDPNGKVHSLSNLYIAGSSVFPTGGYTNPTLTIVALALRLADHLRDMLLPGGPSPAPEKG
jgi:choline dehydrogenase-like flavoprotein